MDLNKIKSIKLASMEVEDDSNMESNKLDFIIRGSIRIDLENLDFDRTDKSIGVVLKEMYEMLTSRITDSRANYLGIWINYDGDQFDNSIKMHLLNDIKKYSTQNIDSLYEFLLMTLPE
jgi:hypothetical protein